MRLLLALGQAGMVEANIKLFKTAFFPISAGLFIVKHQPPLLSIFTSNISLCQSVQKLILQKYKHTNNIYVQALLIEDILLRLSNGVYYFNSLLQVQFNLVHPASLKDWDWV